MKRVVILVLIVLVCLSLILSGCDRYTYKTVTEKETIPFKTLPPGKNPQMWEGEEKVIQEGENGEKVITYKEKYKEERLIDRQKIKEEITKEPKDRIVEVGTKNHLTGFVWEIDSDYPGEENTGKIEITVTNVDRFDHVSPELGPSRNGDFLNITLHVKNNTEKPYAVDEFKFKLGNKVIEREQSFGPPVEDLEKVFTCYGTLLSHNQERAYNQPFTMVNETFLGGEEGNITLSYDLHFGSIEENTEIDGPEDLVIEKYDIYPYQFLPLDKFWQGPFN